VLQALLARLGGPLPDALACAAPALAGRLAEADFAVAVTKALSSDGVAPEAWGECVARMQRQSAAIAGPVLGALVPAYLRLLDGADVERSERRRQQLEAAHAALWDRPSEWALPAEATPRLRERLRPRPADAGGERPTAAICAEGLAALEMEAGRAGGGPVTRESLAALEAAGDQRALARLGLRLPDPTLRQQARRSLLRVRIAASAHAELRADVEAAAELVLAKGANPVSLAARPAKRASFDLGRLPFGGVLVRQDLERQRAALLVTRGDPPVAFPPPAIPLRGPLALEVAGLAQPITVCGDPAELDPSFCLAREDISVGRALASYERGGPALVLAAEVDARELPALASADRNLDPGLKAGGQAVAGLRWPLRFERPADLVLASDSGPGPEVTVEMTAAGGAPVILRVLSSGKERVVVLERIDLRGFHLLSRGARGKPGAQGREGREGEAGPDGPDGRCGPGGGRGGGPRPGGPGGPGGDGEPGGPGGRGSDGGAIKARLRCPPAECKALEVLVRLMMKSEGGQGGPGGKGGKAGAGGLGGEYGRCIEGRSQIAVTAAAGRDGTPGKPGPEGPPGAPGTVTVDVVPEK
jgi:hypothetical protein